MALFKLISNEIEQLDVTTINEHRKATLLALSDSIRNGLTANLPVALNFICTHNSRRSVLAQVWAQTMAAHFGMNRIFTYSGGTEATAVYPSVLATLKESGFKITPLSSENNPVYGIYYSSFHASMVAFSKVWNHAFNPDNKFIAVMTCFSADQNCPFIAGAEQRIALTYEEPKQFDGTSEEPSKYRERSLEIALELKYVFQSI